MDKLPKDLANAKRGYEAFHDEQPSVWFEDLAYAYQMKWVRAARAIVSENGTFRKPAPANAAPAFTKKDVQKVAKGQFWDDLKTLEPQAFLDKYVPKAGTRWGWRLIKDDKQRKAAFGVMKKLQIQARADRSK